MRRTQFITAAVVAFLTFFALQVLVGHRYWRLNRGPWGYRYRGYYNGDCNGYYRDNSNNNSAISPAPQKNTAP